MRDCARARGSTDAFVLTPLSTTPTRADRSGDLSIILSAVATAVKAITSAVRRAGLLNLHGLADAAANATGDQVKKLDLLSNDIFISCLRHTGLVGARVWAVVPENVPGPPRACRSSHLLTRTQFPGIIVSEENEEPVIIAEHPEAKVRLCERVGARVRKQARRARTAYTTQPATNYHAPQYALVFDPLDGSSNIDCNVSVGARARCVRARRAPRNTASSAPPALSPSPLTDLPHPQAASSACTAARRWAARRPSRTCCSPAPH